MRRRARGRTRRLWCWPATRISGSCWRVFVGWKVRSLRLYAGKREEELTSARRSVQLQVQLSLGLSQRGALHRTVQAAHLWTRLGTLHLRPYSPERVGRYPGVDRQGQDEPWDRRNEQAADSVRLLASVQEDVCVALLPWSVRRELTTRAGRYQSGFFWRHPLLDKYKYYWRVE